ncbi:MarR family winged helix-turn-helix transcriptional regulator [Acinetobacter sp. ESBL14]|uniref:MarR family winged helix-turn-helix transcriptional regulator n=1 Tax=Acinetobacter sp. ESBL14 TaxID=3077329 RepID=UPI002FC8A529
MNDGLPPSATLLMLKATCDVKRIGEKISLQRCKIKSLPFAFFASLMSGPCTLTKIAKTLECSKQEASRLLKRADENGWVNVESSEEDRREKQVSLSETGMSLLGIGVEVHQTIEQKLEECLGQEQYEMLNKLLGQAVDCLSTIDKDLK